MPNKLKKLFEVTQLLSYYNASKIEIDEIVIRYGDLIETVSIIVYT